VRDVQKTKEAPSVMPAALSLDEAARYLGGLSTSCVRRLVADRRGDQGARSPPTGSLESGHTLTSAPVVAQASSGCRTWVT
jgi:hypothetical protein